MKYLVFGAVVAVVLSIAITVAALGGGSRTQYSNGFSCEKTQTDAFVAKTCATFVAQRGTPVPP